MISPAQNPEETSFALPARLTLLGRAVGPVARAARQSLARRVQPSGREFVLLEDAIRHMGVIQAALEHLSPRLDGLMANVDAARTKPVPKKVIRGGHAEARF